MVRDLKIIGSILKGNFLGWLINIKLYLVLVLFFIFISDNFNGMFLYAKESGYRVSLFLFPLLFTHPFMKVMIFSCIVFLFADAPFISQLQLSLIARCGRRIWYGTQMIYLGICSFLMTVFLMVFPIVRYLPMIVLQNSWGKVISSLPGYAGVLHPADFYTITRNTPIEAMLYTMVIFFLLIYFLGIVIYLCNIAFWHQGIGTFLASAFVILEWMEHLLDYEKLIWISPLSWIQISSMAYGRDTSLPSQTFAITVMVVIDLLLGFITMIVSKKKDIHITVHQN